MPTPRIALLALVATLITAPLLMRAEEPTKELTAAEKAENDAVAKLLEKKVSFEFAGVPLDDALKNLCSQTKVTFIIDPKISKGEKMPVLDLRIQDMEAKLALGWIMKLCDLDYSIRDKAVHISTPKE